MIIYVDAAKNSVVRTINSYGKQVVFDNGGFRIGILIEETGEEIRSYNTKVTDSFAAETFGLLKAVEAAAERAPAGEKIIIRHDGGTTEKTKSDQANKYVFVMKKIIAERGLDVDFKHVPGKENKADRISRSEPPQVKVEDETVDISAEQQAKNKVEALAEFAAATALRKSKEKAIKKAMKDAGLIAEIQGWKSVTVARAKNFIKAHGLGEILPDAKEAQQMIHTVRFHYPRQAEQNNA